MAANSKIEWTDASWSPIRGCSRISRGCEHCYAERMCARNLPGLLSPTTGEPFARMTASGPQWTGKVELIESQLEIPLHWKKPRRIFVNSMSDTFHGNVSTPNLLDIWSVMRDAHWHTYMVLTKRADHAAIRLPFLVQRFGSLPQLWLGFSAEDQATFDARWKFARQWPVGSVLFVSLEPLLGPIVLPDEFLRYLRPWVILGGESGPGARPMPSGIPRSVRDQCIEAGVPFFMKQLTDGDRKVPFDQWPNDLKIREFPDARKAF